MSDTSLSILGALCLYTVTAWALERARGDAQMRYGRHLYVVGRRALRKVG